MNQKVPPQSNEGEFSLFGPGYGECLVLHLGNGEWAVIDSCKDRTADDRPVALRYLEELGVDVGKAVKLIVVTHWDDDHIGGVAELLSHSISAKFACSAALQNADFLELVTNGRQMRLVSHDTGVNEFGLIFQQFQHKHKRAPYRPDHWASEGTKLFRRNSPHPVKIDALSPSSHTQGDTFARLVMALHEGQFGRCPNPGNNDCSVALQVRFEHVSLLLGADLEVTTNEQRGWRAVIASTTRPPVRSLGYKVPHHGSNNGDLDEIWEQLLHPDPLAVLTTWNKGSKLPREEHIEWLKNRTPHVYCTTRPGGYSGKYPNSVKKIIDRTTKEFSTTKSRPGHIRVRFPLTTPISELPPPELFDLAVRL